MPYVGRFAPSPSGKLHFGSLVAAVGSYLQAKANAGKWLVRIEDLDPPREVPGAASAILRTLEAHGLLHDGSVLYQSQRHEAYQAQLQAWLAQGEAYYCTCSRQEIKAAGGIYTGLCRDKQLSIADTAINAAIRVRIDNPVTSFYDELRGEVTLNSQMAAEDFIVRRRDGLFAYNLAVVLDDIHQGVTQVVRGADLLEPTGRQVSLYQKLGAKPIRYLHLPLALNADGSKLSKQFNAPPIDDTNPSLGLSAALTFLQHPVPLTLRNAPPAELLAWSVANWQVAQVGEAGKVVSTF